MSTIRFEEAILDNDVSDQDLEAAVDGLNLKSFWPRLQDWPRFS